MLYPLSDEESPDSDTGIRFKTTNTRNKVTEEDSKPKTYGNEHSRKFKHSRSSSHHSHNRHYEQRSEYKRHHRKSRYKENKDTDYKSRRDKHDGRYADRDRSDKRHASVDFKRDKYDLLDADNKSKSDVGSRYSTKVSTSKINDHEKIGPSKTVSRSSSKSDVHGPALPPRLMNSDSSSSRHRNVNHLDKAYEKTGINHSDRSYEKTKKKYIDSGNGRDYHSDSGKVMGPSIPSHLKNNILHNSDKCTHTRLQKKYSDSDDDDDDDDVIGPSPAKYAHNSSAFVHLEKRAQQIKLTGTQRTEHSKSAREEWMIELPDIHTANLGLGPRQFRAKGVPDVSDRSSWTETPHDKSKSESRKERSKNDFKSEHKLKQIKQRDLEQERIVENYKKEKRGSTSLLDLHRKESDRKRRFDKLSDKTERRPFNRDIDLKASRFDEAQKNSILKKAQLLDDRFSSGKSKFL